MKEKVFCIGLSKTGTQSLIAALEVLGYKGIHYPSVGKYKSFYDTILSNNLSDKKTLLPKIENYSAYGDIPFAICYQELSRRYPNSKFILTVRNEKEWIESAERHMANKHVKGTLSAVRQKVYGTKSFDREKFLKAFREHNSNVKEFFKKDKKRLLIIDLCKKPSWKPIAKFLDKKVPKVEFPHKNKNRDSKKA